MINLELPDGAPLRDSKHFLTFSTTENLIFSTKVAIIVMYNSMVTKYPTVTGAEEQGCFGRSAGTFVKLFLRSNEFSSGKTWALVKTWYPQLI
jgi:hypothetical protein